MSKIVADQIKAGLTEALQVAKGIPDRLSVDPNSPFYNREALDRWPTVSIDGQVLDSVIEYCISEGWVISHFKDDRGNYVLNMEDGFVTMKTETTLPITVEFKL